MIIWLVRVVVEKVAETVVRLWLLVLAVVDVVEGVIVAVLVDAHMNVEIIVVLNVQLFVHQVVKIVAWGLAL